MTMRSALILAILLGEWAPLVAEAAAANAPMSRVAAGQRKGAAPAGAPALSPLAPFSALNPAIGVDAKLLAVPLGRLPVEAPLPAAAVAQEGRPAAFFGQASRLSQALGTAEADPVSRESSLGGFFDGRLEKAKVGNGAGAGQETPSQRLFELKRVMGDGGTDPAGAAIEAFSFSVPGGWFKARAAGLEGFLYSKLELERFHGLGGTAGQLEDYFRYLDALLSSYAWAAPERAKLAALRQDVQPAVEKNAALNAALIEIVRGFQTRLLSADQSLWLRQSNAYMVLARAYNRLKPGKNFFDSIDEAELDRIKRTAKADVLWILDMFDIGEFRRWGTGGGSPYSIKGYRIKAELGGEKAFKRLVARAHARGLKIAVDEIPNHVSLDSDLVNSHPEALLHLVPPQGLSDAQIMAAVPRHGPKGDPVFFLIHSDSYPEGGRRVRKKVLLHHPMTDYGSDMWIDMAQRDFSRQVTRDWESEEVARMFREWGIDMVRRDMSYEVLRDRYFERWLRILSEERDRSTGWVREEMQRMIEGFQRRWKQRAGAEFLEQATAQAKHVNPAAAMIDEAYSHGTELSRSGSGGLYNKADFDASMGQIGLYDAMVSRDGARVRAALRNVSFRLWQKGGAAMVNFIGTHDGGEGNPFDKFGRQLKAAALTALLMRPTLTYNGVEQGVGQARNIRADLSRSVDREKAIPFDVPATINWDDADVGNQAFLRLLWSKAEEYKRVLSRGAVEVLEPRQPSPIVAWSAAGQDESGRYRMLIGAANFGGDVASAVFRMGQPLLADFGAFEPKRDKVYSLRDLLHLDPDGQPLVYERAGGDLADHGLYLKLGGGDAHLFEVDEIGVPAAGASEASPAPPQAARASRWDRLTQVLTNLAAIPFVALQVPQIIQNVQNLHAGHPEALQNLPWTGYSTGILGNMLLLSFFVSMEEKSAARVQAIGVVTSALVMAQIYLAGFMPGPAFAAVMGTIVAGLTLNLLRFKDRLSAKAWGAWGKASSLVGLVVLPLALLKEFWPGFMDASWPIILAAATGLGGLAMMRLEQKGGLSPAVKKVWGQIAAWTATALFMFGPVAQLVANHDNPSGMAGLSVATLALGMAGNLLMLPRAIHTKNVIWFSGSAWGVVVGGWAVMVSLWLGGFLAAPLLLAATVFIPAYLAAAYALSRRSLLMLK